MLRHNAGLMAAAAMALSASAGWETAPAAPGEGKAKRPRRLGIPPTDPETETRQMRRARERAARKGDRHEQD